MTTCEHCTSGSAGNRNVRRSGQNWSGPTTYSGTRFPNKTMGCYYGSQTWRSRFGRNLL